MGMIPQDIIEMQELISNVLCGIPAALVSGDECVYILFKDLSEELEQFISTGRTDSNQFNALSREDMKAVAECCEQNGLALKYRNLRMDYMHYKVMVACPQISSPACSMRVSLIPWFTLPGRPYPVFAYMFAIWHYNVSEKKSQRLSAAAAGKVFGIDSFNKSTVCRNIKAMGGLPEAIRADSAEPGEKAGTKTTKEVIGCIPNVFKSRPPTESLKEMLGGEVAPAPENVNNTQNLTHAFDAIPQEYSKVIVEAAPAGNRRRDMRKRPARPRKRQEPGVQRILRFADSAKIERIRRGFIVACCSMAIDSAVIYHKFML